MSIQIKASDVQTHDPATSTLASPSFVSGLIKDQQNTIKFISNEIAPFTLSELSIDSSGRVVIVDKAFMTAIKRKLTEKSLNVGCGLGC
jgi:hypothetical protein